MVKINVRKPDVDGERVYVPVTLHFGYISYKSIMTDKNRSLMFDEEGNPNDLGITKIIYSGYQNHCINKDIQAELSFEDFSRVIDESAVTPEGMEEIKACIKAWSESADIQKLVKDQEKKSQIKETNPSTLTESNSLPSENLTSSPGNSEDIPLGN